MKALEKDRERRYQSARELAEDLQRFLQDEPVLACPPSSLYRVTKLVRRHRGALAATALVLLLLVTGLVITSRLALRATQAEHDAIAARIATERSAFRQRQMLYDSDMLLASAAWRKNDAAEVAERLARHRPAPGQVDFRGFEWHYLHRQQSVSGRELCDLEASQYDLEVSPDGRRVVAGGADGRLRIFELDTGEESLSVDTQQVEINGLAFTPHGREIAAVGDDGTLRVFDAASGAQRLEVKAHEGLAYQVVLTPDASRFCTCGRDDRVRVWDARTGDSLGTLNEHTTTLEYLVINDDGLIAAGDHNGRVSVWDSATKKLVSEFESPQWTTVSALAYSATGYLAHGTVAGDLYVFEARSGALVSQRRLTDGIQSIAFGPDGTWLALGDRSGNIRILPFEDGLWDLESSRMWPAHEGRVYSLAISRDGHRVISAGQDGRIVVWEPWNSSALALLQCHANSYSLVPVDAERFLVGTATCLDLYSRNGECIRELTEEDGPWEATVARMAQQAFATNGRLLRGWDLATGQEVFRHEPPDAIRYRGIAVTPDGCTLAAFLRNPEGDFYLELIDVKSGTSLERRRLRSAAAREISPDGRWLVYDSDREIHVMDLERREVIAAWPAHQAGVRSLRISEDGTRLVSAAADRRLKVWSFPDGQLLKSVLAHQIDVHSVAISPDRRRIATAGADRYLRFWDAESLQLLWEYPPARGAVRDLCFLGDGHRLVCLSGSRGLLILDGSPEESPPLDAAAAVRAPAKP
jgi:WD40 repeat protein